MRHQKRCSFTASRELRLDVESWVVSTKRSSVSGRTLCAPYDTELGLCRLGSLNTLSSRVRFICAPGQEAARGHRRTNNRYWTSGGSLHATHFARAQRRHALRRIVDLLPTVQAYFISLLFQRERPCLTPMAAAKNNVVEKTKQALNPCHKITPPKASSRVGLKIVLLRCILHENVAFVVGKIQLSFQRITRKLLTFW
jgi:hypothetical protein